MAHVSAATTTTTTTNTQSTPTYSYLASKESAANISKGGWTIGPIAAVICIMIPVISISLISVGVQHIDECPIQPMIPIWMIVQGALMILILCICGCVKLTRNADTMPSPIKILMILTFLAIVAWFIAGNVMVFRSYKYSEYCHKGTYSFAFYTIVIVDIIIGLIVLAVGGLAGCSIE